MHIAYWKLKSTQQLTILWSLAMMQAQLGQMRTSESSISKGNLFEEEILSQLVGQVAAGDFDCRVFPIFFQMGQGFRGKVFGQPGWLGFGHVLILLCTAQGPA